MPDLRRLRHHPALTGLARVGLVARGVFYLVLAALSVALVVPGPSPQANANGALRRVAANPAGFALLAAAVVGFLAFAVARLLGALSDERQGVWRRVSTGGQALSYVVLAATTASFLVGKHSTGSEQQQHQEAWKVLGLPFGREILAVAGLILIAVCCWQVWTAVGGDFADTLRTERMSRAMRVVTTTTARIGIPARALAFAPIGVFLVVSAVSGDGSDAKGLDALLMTTARAPLGRVGVVLVALGFVVFAAYSFIEARYRAVESGG
ncbi:uncharacterized protein DUF1206 [Motilibacter rhizosphaerae]|uniref:Uncharacterized protein DUF1206 n=1 Tax=Motilibacter rhizosphaerae TaxID=598652 RepID=A0A4Q7NB42_9ACTN|nr:uncharacterized protein DUF1206 [Motilibacter rhizosphaerae]